MELIEPKKEKLKKAFFELQSHSDVLSLFSLTWSDLDSHFTSLENSLTQKLQLLQTLESQSTNPSSSTPISQTQITQDPSPSQKPQDPSSSSNLQTQIAKDPPKAPTQIPKDPPLSTQVAKDPPKAPTQIPKNPPLSTQVAKNPPLSTQIPKNPSPSSNPPTQNHESVAVPPRPELVAFCEKMDAIGLRKYMNDTKNNRNTIRSELHGALRHAQDPALMVLNAMEGFYSESSENMGDKDPEVSSVRRSCVLLLEVLTGISPNVGLEVRERAKKLALEWKGKVSTDGENQFEALGLLHLVTAYGVVSEFNMDELVDHLVIIARYRQATELCRRIGLGDKIGDLIQKLVSKGKHLLAVKFISEFDVTDKFPPVPLLKAYVKESKKLAKKVCEEGNNSKKAANEAIAKETGALKSVIKVIEDLKLESEYPPSFLEKRIEQLEKEKANRKRQAAAPAGKPLQLQQQSKKLKQQQYGNKRPRMIAPIGSAAVSNGAAGLLVESPGPYVSSAAAPYVMSGIAPPVAPYVGSSTGQYGFAGGQMGFPGNPGPSSTHLYSSEQYVPSGYYNRPTAYGGYGVPPQYHPSYYPQ